jgi:hypothetical protein
MLFGGLFVLWKSSETQVLSDPGLWNWVSTSTVRSDSCFSDQSGHGCHSSFEEELSVLPGRGTKAAVPTGNDYDALYAAFEKRIRNILPAKALICQYAKWEIALRNSIAAIRASKWRNGEIGANVRPDAIYESETDTIAKAAYSAANPLERERILDEARWNKLDDLARLNHFHGFTYDAVCAYGLKLQIAEKWISRTKEAAIANLDKAVANVQAPAGQE